MKRLTAAGAALLIAGIAVASPNLGSAQTPGPAWLTFHGSMSRSGTSSGNGPTSSTSSATWNLPYQIESSPVVEGLGKAYIGDDHGNVYAFDPAKPNKPIWTAQLNSGLDNADESILSAPTLSPDGTRLYVGSSDGSLYALNAADGKQVWAADAGGPLHCSPLVNGDGSIVYVNTVNGTIQAFKSTDGTAAWPKPISLNGAIAGSITLSPDGGTIYAAMATDARMFSIPASGTSGGSGVNAFYLDGNALSSPAVDTGGNIYVTTTQGSLMSFAPGSTNAKWTYTSGNHQGSGSTPAIGNGLAIFGVGTNLVAVSTSNGQVSWTATAGGPITSSPAIALGNNIVYVGSGDGQVYAVNTQNGNVIWQRQTGTPVASSPAIGPDSSLWVATLGGKVFHIHDIAPPPAPAATVPKGTKPTATPVSTAVVGPTPVGTSPFGPPVKLQAVVKAGARQTISVPAAKGTTVHFRIEYPNGDHQSGKAVANASGQAVYSFKQGGSKITHKNQVATIVIRIGDGPSATTTTAQYKIAFGAIDISVEPRTQVVGQMVDVFVHTARAKTKVTVVLQSSNHKKVTLHGTTGSKNHLASMKWVISKSFRVKAGTKVTVRAQTSSGPKASTSSWFTIQ